MPPCLANTTRRMRPLSKLCLRHAPSAKFLSSSAQRRADDPAASLADIISPGRSSGLSSSSLPSRPSNEPSDSSNPSLFATQEQMGMPNRSQKPPSTPPNPRADNSPAARTSRMTQILQSSLPNTPAEAGQRKKELRSASTRRSMVENQMTRIWRQGDIYAPHDLSPAEMEKARQARKPRGSASNKFPLNSRAKGGRDVVDELGVRPLAEYKNMAMMSEYVTEMGRIKHSSATGLRAVNQRKMAKAIRRSIGIGLMPSVHRHPELHPDRMSERGQTGNAADRFN